MSTNQAPEQYQRDYTTVTVEHDVLDELHDRKGRGETLSDVVRAALEKTR